MQKKLVQLVLALVLYIPSLLAQGTSVTSWVVNTTGATGYGGIKSNVQQVQYSSNYVYISCTCIPGYSIGPWNGNPNTPSNQNFVYKIPRNPAKNSGTATSVGNGHTGVWTNGVSIFNVSDAMSYNNAGVWNRNAYYWEGDKFGTVTNGFDNCLGHPQQQGEYHHHVSPKCLYNINDSTHHSPIIGYAFDGYPVYGAYAYSSATSSTSKIIRMRTSYHVRSITTRTTLPSGATASSAGPAVSSSYPLGAFQEDYVYTAGYGDLDDRNGRYCITPEYPAGTYAYFVTIDSTLTPEYPYTFFGSYYGVVPAGSIGPTSGHTTITETVTTYVPSTGVPVNIISFTGKTMGDNNRLDWTVNNEIDNACFEIERSADETNFEKIGTINTVGNMADQHSYQFIDNKPLEQGYYRFKQVDKNGSYTYSNLVHINRKETISIKLYPNPTNNYLFLFINPIAQNNFTASIIDGLGKVVLTQKNIQPTISYSFDVTNLPKGIYYLRLQNENTSYSEKVVIK